MQGAARVAFRVLTCNQLLMPHGMGMFKLISMHMVQGPKSFPEPSLIKAFLYDSSLYDALTLYSSRLLCALIHSKQKENTTLPATQCAWLKDGLCVFIFAKPPPFTQLLPCIWGTASIYYFRV